MRVLLVSSARAFGGGERHLLDLARGLAGRGHEVFAALAEGSPLRERLPFLPLRRVRTLPLRNALDLRGAVLLAALAREHEVGVIHAHVARDYTPASFAARGAPRARLVVTRHVLFPLSRAHRVVLSNAARVIAVSEAVARSLRAQKIFDEEKIRVVRNGVDLARFAREREAFELSSAASARARGSAALPFRVGIVGELSAVKNQADFLHAAALLDERFGRRVEFVIAGADASRGGEYGAHVARLVEDLGLRDRARLLGRLGEDELPRLTASLDVLVSASRSEAFGMAMVEALACGVPVVATETEGAREIVEDGVAGLLVPSGDVRAMAEAVASLLEDGERRRSFGARAREVARERFDLARMVEATEKVYEEALGA
ncbi:MAG TPA: glycosyltransferase family 4 protein [Pyrinomonadaceae bacterium]